MEEIINLVMIGVGMAEKGGPIVPESVLKKQKRNEEWSLARKQELAALKEKKAANRKLIYSRAKQYSKEYEEQVLASLYLLLLLVFGTI